MTRTAEPEQRSTGERVRAWAARVRDRVTRFRSRVRAKPGGRLAWRVGVTVAGVAVVAGGIVLLALPGPGWLIIFAGLGILATEYAWASRLLVWLKEKVTWWTHWIARQPRTLQVAVGAVGLLVLIGVVVGVWYAYRQM